MVTNICYPSYHYPSIHPSICTSIHASILSIIYLSNLYDGRIQWVSHLGSLLALLILDPLPEIPILRSVVGPRNLRVKQAFWVIPLEVVPRPLSENTDLGPHPILLRKKWRQKKVTINHVPW